MGLKMNMIGPVNGPAERLVPQKRRNAGVDVDAKAFISGSEMKKFYPSDPRKHREFDVERPSRFARK